MWTCNGKAYYLENTDCRATQAKLSKDLFIYDVQAIYTEKRKVIYKVDDQIRDYMFMIISSYPASTPFPSVRVCLSVCECYTYLCMYHSPFLYIAIQLEFIRYINAVFS